MAKVWVLDTETKGTGAQIVPLEKILQKSPAERKRIVSGIKPESRPPAPDEPDTALPPRFRVVDAMTREVLADWTDTRATVDVLEGCRRLVDVSIYLWQAQAEEWRRLSHREEKLLWGFRGDASPQS